MRIRSISQLLIAFGMIAFLSTCDVINPEEAIPAYLHIRPFTLETEVLVEGTASHKITEGWVFVNGDFLGAYSLPATLPVLAEGNTEIRIEAGIKDNGVSARPEIYPFYASYPINLDLTPNVTDTIRPTTAYLPETKFGFIEDFEIDRPRIFATQVVGETDIILQGDDVFEGDQSGLVTLQREDRAVVEIASSLDFSGLLDDGVYVYLEVNYKSDVPVFWGILGEPDPLAGLINFYETGFTPKDEWNKIYFNIGTAINSSQFEEYRIGFRAFIDEASPDSANVYLDNIKLLHF